MVVRARYGSRSAILSASWCSGSAARGGIGERWLDQRIRSESRASDGQSVKTWSWLRTMRRLFGGYPMRALRSRVPQKRCLNSEWRRALALLASDPRGTTEHMLARHGLSSDMPALLVLAG